MAQPKRVLIPMSSHDDMGISGIKTGSWFEEVAAPYYEFLDAGFQVVFASPKGGIEPQRIALPTCFPLALRAIIPPGMPFRSR